MPKDIAQEKMEQFKRGYAGAERQVELSYVYRIFG